MSSILSNVLVGVGKQVLNTFSTENKSSASSRAEQLEQFGKRLDYAMDPEKASFKQYLSSQFVDSLNGIDYLSEKVKNGLLSDPELARFVSRNGGFEADFSIEKNGLNYQLTSSSGEQWIVDANSSLEQQVDKLYRLENVKQLAALQPGLSLDQLVDLSFQMEGVQEV